MISASNNKYLEKLESESIYIIREAYWQHRCKAALLWSIGKDSTVLLHLIRKAFFGEVPFPVIHIDTTFKFKEIYEFRDKVAREYRLNLIVAKNDIVLKMGMSPKRGSFECCNTLKTEALKKTVRERGLKALLLAIRRDEHLIRAKERVFSQRNRDFKWDYRSQPLEMWREYSDARANRLNHLRVHPLLGWREIDVWRYIKKEGLAVVDLYFSKNKIRYRSIGCQCCCQPVKSEASNIDEIIEELITTRVAERSGRLQDKEKLYMMQKLRSLGYM